jgi:hypothetical protein
VQRLMRMLILIGLYALIYFPKLDQKNYLIVIKVGPCISCSCSGSCQAPSSGIYRGFLS